MRQPTLDGLERPITPALRAAYLATAYAQHATCCDCGEPGYVRGQLRDELRCLSCFADHYCFRDARALGRWPAP